MGKVNNRRNFIILLLTILAPLTALGAQSGEVPDALWKVPTGGRVIGLVESPYGSTVYALSEDRMIYAITADGRVLWQSERLENRVRPFLTVGPDATLYVQTWDNRLIALNRAGRVVWRVGISGNILGEPVIGPEGVIYYATSAGVLAARNHLGKLLWQYKPEDFSIASLSFGAGNKLWVRDQSGLLRLFDHDGSPSTTGEWFYPPLPEGGREVLSVLADARQLVILIGGSVCAYSVGGELSWVLDIASPPANSHLTLHTLVLILKSGEFLLVDRHTGEVRWRIRGVPPDAYPLQGEKGSGPVLAVGGSGTLFLDPRNGNPAGMVRNPQPGTPPILTGSGTPVIGGEDWVVYMLRLPEYPYFKTQESADSVDSWEEHYGREDGVKKREEPEQIYTRLLLESLSRENLEGLLENRISRLSSHSPESRYHSTLSGLEQLAGVGVLDPAYRAGRLINDFPDIRLSAVEALGEYGTLHSRDLLLDILRYEWNPSVKVEIVRALGKMRSDPEGEVVDTLFHLAKSGALAYEKDPMLASALIETVDSLTRYGGLVRDSSSRLLNEIYFSTLPRTLRMKAVETLRNFRTEK